MVGGGTGCNCFYRSWEIRREWETLKYLPRPEPPLQYQHDHEIWEKEYAHWRHLRCGTGKGYFCRLHGLWIFCEEVGRHGVAEQQLEKPNTCPGRHYKFAQGISQLCERYGMPENSSARHTLPIEPGPSEQEQGDEGLVAELEQGDEGPLTELGQLSLGSSPLVYAPWQPYSGYTMEYQTGPEGDLEAVGSPGSNSAGGGMDIPVSQIPRQERHRNKQSHADSLPKRTGEESTKSRQKSGKTEKKEKGSSSKRRLRGGKEKESRAAENNDDAAEDEPPYVTYYTGEPTEYL